MRNHRLFATVSIRWRLNEFASTNRKQTKLRFLLSVFNQGCSYMRPKPEYYTRILKTEISSEEISKSSMKTGNIFYKRLRDK